MTALLVTGTGAIVNEAAMEHYSEAYMTAGTTEGALFILWQEALREAWARRTVAAAGKSWDTHLAKFSGAVLPR